MMGGKKKTLNIECLDSNIRFIIEFRMQLSRLVTLIPFIVFREPLGLENPFNRLMDLIWEDGRLLAQE